jgi:hypothetical protein
MKEIGDKQMQFPPLGLSDLNFLMAVIVIMLLVIAELISLNYGISNVNVNIRKMRTAAIFASIIYLMIISTQIVSSYF